MKPFQPGDYVIWRRVLAVNFYHPVDIPVRVHRVYTKRALVGVQPANGEALRVVWADLAELRAAQ